MVAPRKDRAGWADSRLDGAAARFSRCRAHARRGGDKSRRLATCRARPNAPSSEPTRLALEAHSRKEADHEGTRTSPPVRTLDAGRRGAQRDRCRAIGRRGHRRLVVLRPRSRELAQPAAARRHRRRQRAASGRALVDKAHGTGRRDHLLRDRQPRRGRRHGLLRRLDRPTDGGGPPNGAYALVDQGLDLRVADRGSGEQLAGGRRRDGLRVRARGPRCRGLGPHLDDPLVDGARHPWAHDAVLLAGRLRAQVGRRRRVRPELRLAGSVSTSAAASRRSIPGPEGSCGRPTRCPPTAPAAEGRSGGRPRSTGGGVSPTWAPGRRTHARPVG